LSRKKSSFLPFTSNVFWTFARYARTDHTRLLEIITNARVQVIEETSYDNWNGGTYEHDVILYLPADVIGELGFDWQKELAKSLKVCSQRANRRNR